MDFMAGRFPEAETLSPTGVPASVYKLSTRILTLTCGGFSATGQSGGSVGMLPKPRRSDPRASSPRPSQDRHVDPTNSFSDHFL